ncbi:MAG: TonB-dependent receptor domain-containing protein [Rudaea sp.]
MLIPLRWYPPAGARALACAAALVAAPSLAQLPGPPAALEPVFVTASRSPQRLLDLVADVTLIDARAIARSGVADLPSLLARQPGVEIVQNGGPGATSGVFLRGANAAQTLVLVDGMRVASASSGATALEAIPLGQIDHIEILRGPASSLYGADAIGGVIQIFTRRGATGARAHASAAYGTFETWDAAAGVAGGNASARGSVDVAGRRSAGFNAIVNPANLSYDPDRDGYRNASVSANGALDYADAQRLVVQYFKSHLDSAFDAGDAFDDRTITTVTSWQAASENRLTGAWNSRVSFGDGSDRSVSKTGFGDFPFETHQRQLAWQNDVTLPAGALTLALERREERVESDAGFPVTERDTNAVTAIYRLDAGAHAVQANVRHDHSSQYGRRTTGALAWGYRVAPAWRVTASAGTAFKAPTFNDLYFPDFSNPDLRPETSRNFEAGVHWTARAGGLAWEAHAVAFHNRVDDLIVFQCDVNFICAPDNVADAVLKGVTLYGDLDWRDTALHASVDLQSPADVATGRLLPRRARRHAALGLRQALGRARVTGELVASSGRFDDAANARRMGGYALVNVVLEWPLDARTTLFLRGDNVLDHNYELAADFATGGAKVSGGVRWRL